ncbi:MAG: DUF3619 family protein [Thiobacillaceae bacterium]
MLRVLDTGLGALDRDVAEALAAARHRAVARRHGYAARHPVLAAAYDLRLGFAAATLAAAIVLMSWWTLQRPTVQDTGQIDIQLLTGELPPGAYIDKDFPTWRRLPGLCRS